MYIAFNCIDIYLWLIAQYLICIWTTVYMTIWNTYIKKFKQCNTGHGCNNFQFRTWLYNNNILLSYLVDMKVVSANQSGFLPGFSSPLPSVTMSPPSFLCPVCLIDPSVAKSASTSAPTSWSMFAQLVGLLEAASRYQVVVVSNSYIGLVSYSYRVLYNYSTINSVDKCWKLFYCERPLRWVGGWVDK